MQADIKNPFIYHNAINHEDALFRLQRKMNILYKHEIKQARKEDAKKKIFLFINYIFFAPKKKRKKNIYL